MLLLQLQYITLDFLYMLLIMFRLLDGPVHLSYQGIKHGTPKVIIPAAPPFQRQSGGH